ncbi:HD domain-containing protein [Candidatus Margulisiibacteriota bacterium]
MCHPFVEDEIYKNPHATLSKNSKGRERKLKPDNYRTEFERDIHRIIYSQPFRRLRHKTQVFFLPSNDHICTRMEHVLHVASASRIVTRHLQLNEDLAEAIGLGHDLGHSPFGHYGETVLDEICKNNNLDISFQHEINGLRVVDKLAELDREPQAGLNLTYEVRDGIISHCGEDFSNNLITPEKTDKNLEAIKDKKNALMPITLEGCVVRFVDKITYAGRDLEDAIKAKLIGENDIPKEITSELGNNNGEIIGRLLEDLIDTSKKHQNQIGLSPSKFDALKKLIEFNHDKIYQHEKVKKFQTQVKWALEVVFKYLLKEIQNTNRFKESSLNIPVIQFLKKFVNKIKYSDNEKNEIIVLDFISGMTDNYVLECINELFVPKYIV